MRKHALRITMTMIKFFFLGPGCLIAKLLVGGVHVYCAHPTTLANFALAAAPWFGVLSSDIIWCVALVLGKNPLVKGWIERLTPQWVRRFVLRLATTKVGRLIAGPLHLLADTNCGVNVSPRAL